MSSGPLVSLVLPVKNGMPYLPEAVWSVAAQTYRHFELIVQDGVSVDGTLEFLRTIKGIPKIDVVSSADSSSAEGFSRALARCNGEIVGTIGADDVLEEDALEWAVTFFGEHPDVAAVYGATKMIDQDGNTTSVYTPASFDLLRVMSCEVVPPLAASFFSRRVCGDELRFDAGAAHCDFDLWLRLGHLPIVATPQHVARVRIHAGSNTCRLENYDWYCRDKIAIVQRHLARYGSNPLTEAVLRHAAAGIFLWGADSILNLGPDADLCRRLLAEVSALAPGSARLRELERRLAAAEGERSSRTTQHSPGGTAGGIAAHAHGGGGGPLRRATTATCVSRDDGWAAQRLEAAQRHVDGGDWNAAAEALNQALDRDPLLAQGHYLLGCVELRRGRVATAVAALREASRLMPDAADVQNAFGVALLAAGSAPEAEAAFQTALALAADRADIWANLAELYQRQGRRARAAAAYARAAALAPEDTEVREALERVQESAVVVS